MKILKLKNSLLFIRVHPETDTAKCLFVFFISWNCFLTHKINHNLNKLTMSQVKEFYNQLANDWNRKYRI